MKINKHISLATLATVLLSLPMVSLAADNQEKDQHGAGQRNEQQQGKPQQQGSPQQQARPPQQANPQQQSRPQQQANPQQQQTSTAGLNSKPTRNSSQTSTAGQSSAAEPASTASQSAAAEPASTAGQSSAAEPASTAGQPSTAVQTSTAGWTNPRQSRGCSPPPCAAEQPMAIRSLELERQHGLATQSELVARERVLQELYGRARQLLLCTWFRLLQRAAGILGP